MGSKLCKRWGYDYNCTYWKELKRIIKSQIKELGCQEVETSLSLGVETIAALATLELKDEGYKIKLRCDVPCLDYGEKWSKESKELLNSILSKTDTKTVMYCCKYKPWVIDSCIEQRIDNSNVLLAIYDSNSDSVQKYVKYAIDKNKIFIPIKSELVENNVKKINRLLLQA